MLNGPHAEDAATALKLLSENEDAQKQIVELNAVPAIAQMLGLEGLECFYAAAVLSNIGSEETDQCVLDSGVIPALVATLQRSDARSANLALNQLAKREILGNCIVSCNGVKSLVAMLDGPHGWEVATTLGWLTNSGMSGLSLLVAIITLLYRSCCRGNIQSECSPSINQVAEK
ncbi:hypothetical protein FIBSPDRAFT_481309 [Athelia psychrophila]|uniref:ARM repeat-containing protein n=1 Tax=Athelia psychrophila TaxID=1759441 RepID=A0A166VG27_9AGAM|nr:hypothetical protein FIBSPDRAFT_481309 [Fibularhizoctonia sp. CBS 109695]